MDVLGLGWAEWPLWVVLALAALYKLGTWNYNYFNHRGVKTAKTVPFFGCFAGTTFKKRSFADLISDIYNKFKGERLVGAFQFFTPVLMVKDTELIKRITVKDFDHFVDHVQTISKDADPLMGRNLFFLRGEKWRDLRSTLSPAFTSSKMRNMFILMDECGQQLADHLLSEVDKEAPGKPYVVEMKDVFTRFTTDVIGTTAFGININSLKVQDNDFFRMGKQITNLSVTRMVKMIVFSTAPKVFQLLGITFFTKEERKFFTDLVEDTVTTRERDGIVRNDMIDLLMQARHGELKADGEEEEQVSIGEGKAKRMKLTVEDIAAQALGFFFAGFDSASSMLSFVSILMAIHEDVQKKVQEELDEILGDDRKVTYDKVQKTKYLDMVLAETLRMYPPTPAVDRLCTKTFTIPASGDQPAYTLQPGDVVFLPVYGLQHDPELFPDPEKFDPERFSDENKANINPYAYFPFGLGPRMCLGKEEAPSEPAKEAEQPEKQEGEGEGAGDEGAAPAGAEGEEGAEEGAPAAGEGEEGLGETQSGAQEEVSREGSVSQVSEIPPEEESVSSSVKYGGCEGQNAMYLRLLTSDKHEFIVRREFVMQSSTIKAILGRPSESDEVADTVQFMNIPSHIMRMVCEYFNYRAYYSKTAPPFPPFEVPPEMALTLLMTANMLQI